MQPAAQTVPLSKARLWTGRVISAFCAIFLLLDGAMKVMNVAPVREAQARLGYPERVTVGIGIVLLICTAAYVIPRTSILGAVLLTGYLGGATATHVRIGDPYFFPVVLGVLIWTGLLVRDRRLRELIPVRRTASGSGSERRDEG